jgi:predicted porin
MQKKLIALAITAAFSTSAFADANVYGVIDAAVGSLSNSGQKSDVLAISGGMAASRLGVKGSQDLGNGLKAVGVLEYGLDTQSVNAVTGSNSGIGASRQGLLGVAGDFGTVATGYLQTTGYDFGGKFDPLAGSIASPLQNLTKAAVNGTGLLIGAVAAASRAPRALAYISPKMSGFTVAVNYSTAFDAGLGNLTKASAATAGLKRTATMASVNYEQGPLAAGLVYAGLNDTNALNGNVSEWALGGSYNLDIVKLYATYQSQSSKLGQLAAGTSFSNKAYSLSATAPVGTDTVAFSYAASTITTANSNGSGFTLGYLHPLNPMTKLYAAISRESNGSAGNIYSVDNSAVGGGVSTLGASSTLVAVGLNYKF